MIINDWRSQLRDQREALGITQWDLADAIGVENACISRWETGQRTPTMANLQKWAWALGCAIEIQFHPNHVPQV